MRQIPKRPPFTAFQRWLQLPGNEIWANLDMQKNLPGMNARTFNAGPPVPESSYAPVHPVGAEAAEAGEVRAPQAIPEGLPPTFERQWRSPLVQQREQNPAVQIMPWPALITNVTGTLNAVRAIVIPEGAVLFTVSYSTIAATVFVGNTRYTLPLPTVTADLDDALSATLAPMINPPSGIWWNCEGMRQLFIGASGASVHICVSFWTGYQPRIPAIETKMLATGH